MSKKFKPSPYQEAIYSFVKDGHESLIINAVAGSGKTVTIVGSTEFTDPNLQIGFVAFNKSIATELQQRVPKHVKAGTCHSFWFGALRKYMGGGNIRVEARKTWQVIDAELGDREIEIYGAFVSKMVGLGKGHGIGYLVPNTPGSWADLADHHNVWLEHEEANEMRAYELCMKILERSNHVAKVQKIVDFDDMLYLSLIWNVRCWQYDMLYVDEAQDTNAVQVALFKRMLRPGGRLIAVGDPYQAIYGFRGADAQAMERIREEFGCKELPLSVSYRCAKAVVKAAQEYVSHLEWWEKSPEGRVDHLGALPITDMELKDREPVAALTGQDAILCRVTAPLVEQAYALIRQRVACRILGRDIGVGLVNLVKKMNAKGIDRLIEKLNNYMGREVAKLTSKGKEDKAQAVSDKVETLMVIINNLGENERTIPKLVQNIESLFTDNNKGMLTLATVHKSKGLEWDRVFILGADEYMPSKWARKEWMKVQEYNLIYVAYTRAKRELYFVPAPKARNKG
jgi:superfamily I DNA/RNA helicase